MDIRLLGPLAARINDRSVVPSAAKPRQVLALLALHARQVVPVSTLIDEIWADRPPRSMTTTLQTYVRQLRRLIETALTTDDRGRTARDVLATEYGGYSLQVEPEEIDVPAFEQLAGAGRAAYDRGDDRTAATMLNRALSLWRGPALANLPLGRVLELEVMSLEESRMGALERRIEVDLRLGRHVELLGELSRLVAQHPMHENLRALYMTSLYRSGHSARALEAYQRLRTVLIEELGIEPAPRVQRLQQAILVGDPALDQPEHAFG
ncbi:MAG TPA: AfsR/SARP family transcriptional regulator [Streptosporangiaceae bacterium]|jgi:DNA-binding SARP family transcriptional activator